MAKNAQRNAINGAKPRNRAPAGVKLAHQPTIMASHTHKGTNAFAAGLKDGEQRGKGQSKSGSRKSASAEEAKNPALPVRRKNAGRVDESRFNALSTQHVEATMKPVEAQKRGGDHPMEQTDRGPQVEQLRKSYKAVVRHLGVDHAVATELQAQCMTAKEAKEA